MTAIDLYVGAFAARCAAWRTPGRPVLEEPGIHGLLPSAEDPLARLLVTDDRARDVLAALAPDVRAGVVTVLAAAGRCSALWSRRPGWTANPVTAMVCPDVRAISAVPLPAGLTLRPVRRLADDPPGGVPLEDAVAAAMRADPRIDGPPAAFAAALQALPPGVRLFAAIDETGAVRATSGTATFGADAGVIFVNTDPELRRRGIGLAMTAAALRAARDAGAQRACLDASDAGASIYARLGFEPAGRATQFVRSG